MKSHIDHSVITIHGYGIGRSEARFERMLKWNATPRQQPYFQKDKAIGVSFKDADLIKEFNEERDPDDIYLPHYIAGTTIINRDAAEMMLRVIDNFMGLKLDHYSIQMTSDTIRTESNVPWMTFELVKAADALETLEMHLYYSKFRTSYPYTRPTIRRFSKAVIRHHNTQPSWTDYPYPSLIVVRNWLEDSIAWMDDEDNYDLYLRDSEGHRALDNLMVEDEPLPTLSGETPKEEASEDVIYPDTENAKKTESKPSFFRGLIRGAQKYLQSDREYSGTSDNTADPILT